MRCELCEHYDKDIRKCIPKNTYIYASHPACEDFKNDKIKECKGCKGAGLVKGKGFARYGQVDVKCGRCKGKGYMKIKR